MSFKGLRGSLVAVRKAQSDALSQTGLPEREARDTLRSECQSQEAGSTDQDVKALGARGELHNSQARLDSQRLLGRGDVQLCGDELAGKRAGELWAMKTQWRRRRDMLEARSVIWESLQMDQWTWEQLQRNQVKLDERQEKLDERLCVESKLAAEERDGLLLAAMEHLLASGGEAPDMRYLVEKH